MNSRITPHGCGTTPRLHSTRNSNRHRVSGDRGRHRGVVLSRHLAHSDRDYHKHPNSDGSVSTVSGGVPAGVELSLWVLALPLGCAGGKPDDCSTIKCNASAILQWESSHRREQLFDYLVLSSERNIQLHDNP